ncbi:MAG: SMI1/KNR4 family protein [bacterium]|jgi:hypothetical protein
MRAYEGINWEDTGQLIDAAIVNQFEVRAGYRLPSEYRAFVLAINGGDPSPAFFVYTKTGPRAMVAWTWVSSFLRCRVSAADDNVGTLQEHVRSKSGLVPLGFLPVASLPGHAMLLLDCRPGLRGAVWVQDEELCETEDERGGGCFFVAESFAAFLSMLKEMPKGAEYSTPCSEPQPHQPIPPLPPGVRLPLWIDRGEQLTAAEVAQIGENLGVELPASYAAFLAEHNGGRPTRHLFDVPGVDDPEARVLDVHVLLRGIRAENREVGLEFANCDEDVADSGMIVIGLCDRRRTIWLCCEGPRAGQVWRREIEMEVEGDEEGGWRKLADSFEAFVGGLRE